jgi:hypothetical protein
VTGAATNFVCPAGATFETCTPFWDGAAGLFATPVQRPLPANGEPITTIARSIAAAYPAGTLPEQTELSTHKWLDEGAALLSRVVYPASSTLDEAYVVRARETAKKRVALAGYRLAALLNTIWPETGAPVPGRRRPGTRRGVNRDRPRWKKNGASDHRSAFA